jgi:hypothetical protein
MDSNADPGKDVRYYVAEEGPCLLEHPLTDITTALNAPAEWAEQAAQQAVLLLAQLRELLLDLVQAARQLAEQGLELIDDWWNDQKAYKPDQQQSPEQSEDDSEPSRHGKTPGDQVGKSTEVNSE